MSDASQHGLDEQALAFLHEVGGKPFVVEMVGLFRSHPPAKLAAARVALAEGRIDAVSMVAHSLKSSAGQLGCPDLAECCRQLEAMAAPQAGGSQHDMASALATVEVEYQRALALLTAYLEGDDSDG